MNTVQNADSILRSLADWGVDIPTTLERFVDDSDFYMQCLYQFADDRCFALLGTAITERAYTQANDIAYNLKGVSGNLGLTKICEETTNLICLFREQRFHALPQQYAQLIAAQQKLKDLLKLPR